MPSSDRPGESPAPSHRPRRTRDAARLLVRHGDAVLLFRDTDPGVPGSSWWTTPGGGVDPGESWADAALRELREETGVTCPPERLIGPLAERLVVHGYSDRITEQRELFFEVWLDDADRDAGIDTSGFTASERRRVLEHRWVPVSEVVALTVWPVELPDLLGRSDDRCRALGWREESTVPVSGPGAAPDGC